MYLCVEYGTIRTMDRFGLFIDAGYLLTESGKLCLGASRRADIVCNYATVHQALVDFTQAYCGLPILRTYWYDGSIMVGTQPQPTTDHLRIAALPNLKLRLGRVSGGRQKGVDSLVMRDLMTLSRERAISTVYLLSGDEDLREGVVAAQDLGVRVVLLGIPCDVNNQAVTLINECDDHHVLNRDFLVPHFASTAPEKAIAEVEALEPVPIPEPDMPVADAARSVGARFCDEWVSKTDAELVGLVAARLPMVPKDIDAPMLRTAEAAFGLLRAHEELRREVRNGFVDRLRELAPQVAVSQSTPP